ncbi:hypothetical protein Cni_G13216 [Canna indica]|uniref:Uncharacterized protein n=1 Tax=Canna indica TaxID=4628 RepID=A0AAQ3K9P8_9LILI|nr:hypothetical protein Cni_G13216 [Canna indica]
MLAVKEPFSIGIEVRLGNGLQTNFWNDRWLGNHTLAQQFRDLFENSRQKNSSVVGMAGSSGSSWLFQWWDASKLRTGFGGMVPNWMMCAIASASKWMKLGNTCFRSATLQLRPGRLYCGGQMRGIQALCRSRGLRTGTVGVDVWP